MTRNLHDYSRNTIVRLVLGGLFLLFTLGLGLIWWRYGSNAALLGLICLLSVFFPVLLIFLLLKLIEMIARHANK